MLANVFAKTLRDQRRSLLWWLLGIGLLMAFTLAFWPSLEESAEDLVELTEDLPAAFQAFIGEADLATARGYLSTRLFAFLLPLLVATLGIGKAARTIAGEEERGDLELLLAQPVARWRLAVEKTAAVLTMVALVVVVAFALLVAGVAVLDMEVTVGEIAGAMLGLGLLGWLFAAVSLAVGAATGRRAVAVGIGAVVAVMCYLATTFAPLVDGLGWLEASSPWTWAFGSDALAEGPSAAGGTGLLALTVGLLALGTWRFTRRDVGV